MADPAPATAVTPPPVSTPAQQPPTATTEATPPSAVTAPEPAAPASTPPAAGTTPEPQKDKPAAPVAFAPDKLTLPEGLKPDDPTFQKFGQLMADDKLDPQARGQALLDLYSGALKQASEAGTEAWNTLNKEWADKAMADPEIGGAKFATTKSTIAKAIDTLGPDLASGFRQALDVTGAGNNPAIIKGLHALAAKVTEGGHVTGSPPGSRPMTIKEAFYPNSADMK